MRYWAETIAWLDINEPDEFVIKDFYVEWPKEGQGDG